MAMLASTPVRGSASTVIIRPPGPRVVRSLPPSYPPAARRAGTRGIVVVSGTVGYDGRLRNLTVLRSVPGLDSLMLTTLRRWRYATAPAQGFRDSVELFIYRFGGNRWAEDDSARGVERMTYSELEIHDRRAAEFRADSLQLAARADSLPSDRDAILRERLIRAWRDLDPHPTPHPRQPIDLAWGRRQWKAVNNRERLAEIRRSGGSTPADSLAGVALLADGSLQEAALGFAHCLAGAPWMAWPYREAADLLVEIGRPADAAVCLDLFLVALPDAHDWETVRHRLRQLRGVER
jgi:TonB family protein